MHGRRLAVLFLIFFFCFWGRTPSAAQGERLVLAFYYAWYDHTTWQKGLPDLPAQPYASADPAAIERHVLWARRAGIDGFVQSWYGPWVQNNQTETNFALLLDIAARHGFSAAVDLEVTSPFIGSPADVATALRHVLTVHAAHPAYLRVGGRAVVFFWRQQRYPVETWEAIRQEVDPGRQSLWIAEGTDLEYLRVFDGNHLYSVAWSEAPEGVLARWGKRVRDWGLRNGRAPLWVATVMPGYDDRVTGRPDAFVRDRAGGEYYRRCWQGAIASGADWVVITSFNEWMEGTQIEPSTGYGEFYLDLTSELAAAFRAAPVAAPPRPTPAPSPSPSPAPTLPPPPPTASPTPSPTPSPSPSPTPTATWTPVPSPTATPVPTATPPPPTPTPPPPASPTPVPVAGAETPLGTWPTALWNHAAWLALGTAALLALRQGLRAIKGRG